MKAKSSLPDLASSLQPVVPPATIFAKVRAAWVRYGYRVLAHEISAMAHCFDECVQSHRLEHDDGLLFDLIDSPNKRTSVAAPEAGKTRLVVLNGNLNYSLDAQVLLTEVGRKLNRESRLVVVIYNSYLRYLFALLNAIGIRHAELPKTFITNWDLRTIAKLAGFEVVRTQPVLHFPFRWLFVGPVLNAILRTVPVVRWMGVGEIAVLRPVQKISTYPSLSIIVPARNEAGNIPKTLDQLTGLEKAKVEVIFVEGHSEDDTREAIEKLVREYRGPFTLKCFGQTGKGKKNAVEVGLAKATGDLLVILDADLTVPPTQIARFYESYREGHGDLLNGNRLVYPQEDGAMRFLNLLGNVFFAKALSFVLDAKLGDSLCGTKMFSAAHYRAILRWNERFGDFDPFGDFALLFPGAALGIGVADVPVRYLARTYGKTNIQRFRHGLILLRMTLTGFFSIKMGTA